LEGVLKPKTIPELKGALQLIWPALRQKSIHNPVTDFRKRLQPYVSVIGGILNKKCDDNITVAHSYV